MTKYLRAFAWYGGKNSHLHWLLDLLPKGKVYVEPFAGSAAVLLNREVSSVEVLNDLDGRITNFFKQLRDNGDELIRRLELTPYSRLEFVHSIETLKQEDIIQRDPIEAARCFLVNIKQAFLAKPKASNAGDWGRTLHAVRRGMSQSVSGWLSIVEQLYLVVARLKSVVIENRDALKLMTEYDGEDTVFYCDPPYVLSSRSQCAVNEYMFEMEDELQIKFLETVKSLKGKVAISAYDNELYREHLKGWFVYENKPHCLGGDTRKSRNDGIRQEVLFCNYDFTKVLSENQQDSAQMTLTELV